MLAVSLVITDTVKFKTKAAADYGSVQLRFKNIEMAKKPVLQFAQDDVVKETFAVTGAVWSYKLFPPGEYEIRIYLGDGFLRKIFR